MPAIRRLAFFGSPEFAVPSLDALAASRYRPALVVTQPPRPAGRGRREEETAVAARAREHGIEVWQSHKVRDPAFLAAFAALDFDIAVVVAFGQIFPAALLALPRLGCVNLHASLLPRHRGAAPIQAAIAAGDRETGVTTMRMEAGLDTGPTFLQRATLIGDDEDAPALSARLARAGAELILETLEGIESGTLEAVPQDDELATLAPRLDKHDGLVDWSLDAAAIWRRSRAYRPWPGLTALCGGEPLKLHDVRPLARPAAGAAAPGTYLGLEDGALAVAAGGGTILGLYRVQRPGRRALAAPEFLRGEHLTVGAAEFAAPASGE
ncbi:MAG TPA: methionyl-tRNA formyltransferase [Thermoanaerobaculia bacterium]|nr:methionyl-tRNA formyltransferase [Thermoanaerobaculia bacterium]